MRGLKINDTTLVLAIIEKLPLSWDNFARDLKHKRGLVSLDDVIVSIRIEENLRVLNKSSSSGHLPKAHLVESKHSYKKIKSHFQHKKNYSHTKNKLSKSHTSVPRPCYVCGKTNHVVKNCYHRLDKKRQGQPSKATPKVYMVY